MQYAFTYNGYVIKGYIDGVPGAAANWDGGPIGNFITNGVTIGVNHNNPTFNFNGLMADVQIYNASLNDASINALYREGIGGAPIQLQNLVGRRPLNGDANDYSGNDNNGVPTATVSYTGSWTNGYTVP